MAEGSVLASNLLWQANHVKAVLETWLARARYRMSAREPFVVVQSGFRAPPKPAIPSTIGGGDG